MAPGMRGIGAAAIVMVFIVVIVAAATGLHSPSSMKESSSNGSSNVTTMCIISGQPGGLFVRVLSDSTREPVVGAQVAAANEPARCNGQLATPRSVVSFVTGETEWYELPSDNNGGYSINVSHSGRTYTMTADLEPVSMTCATIYLPSGTTNVTIREFGSSCPSVYPSQAVLSSSTWRFSASINASSVMFGQTILLSADITNIAPTTQTIRPYVNPPINPVVREMNGIQAWAWNPPVATWPDWNVTAGRSLGGEVPIPTTRLQPGHDYLVEVAPLSSQFPANLTATFEFSVQ